MKRWSWLLVLLFGGGSLAAAELTVELEHMVPNLLKNPTFDVDLSSWTCPGWTKDEIVPVHDSVWEGVVRFDGGKDGKDVIRLFQTLILNERSGRRYQLTGRMRKSEPGVVVQLQGEEISIIDGKEKFKYHTAKPTGIDEDGFQLYSLTFEIAPECRYVRLVLSGKSKLAGPWQLWADDLRLGEISGNQETVVLENIRPAGEHGLFLPGERPEVTFEVSNSTGKSFGGLLSVSVRDFYGQEVERMTADLILPENTIGKGLLKLDPLKKMGFFSLHGALSGEKERVLGSFAVVSPVEKRDAFFGFCGYGLYGYEKSAIMLNAGSGGVPVYHLVERSPGVFDWKDLDARLKEMEKYQIKPLVIVLVSGMHSTQPGWLKKQLADRIAKKENPHNDEYFAQVDRFNEALVRHCATRARDFSAGQEIDLAQHHNPYELTHYLRRVKEFYQTVKRIDPQLTFAAIGVSGCDMQSTPPLKDTEMLMQKLHPFLDQISFDSYINPCSFGPGLNPIGPEKGKMRELMQKTAELSKKYGKKQFAIDEMGFNILRIQGQMQPLDSVYEKNLAAVVSRSYIIAKSIPEMSHYLYFKIQGSLQGNLDWALFADGVFPRAAAVAYGTTAGRLAFAGNAEQLVLHDQILLYFFERQGVEMAVIWSIAPETVQWEMELPGSANVFDLMNNQVTVTPGRNQLILTECPIFIEFPEEARTVIKQRFVNADFTLPELTAHSVPAGQGKIRTLLVNQTSQTLPVELSVQITGGAVSPVHALRLGPGERKFVNTVGIVSAEQGGEIVTEVKTATRLYRFVAHERVLKAGKMIGQFTLTPSVVEFAAAERIDLDGLSSLDPVDASANQLWMDKEDFSAQLWLGYDLENLYFAVKTHDDVKVRDVRGGQLWARDAIQFAVSPDCLPEQGGGYGAGDWEFALGMTPEGPELFCYSAPVKSGMSGKSILQKAVAFTVTDLSGQDTLYKIALPWRMLGIEFSPEKMIAFSLIATDSDQPGEVAKYWMRLSGGITGGKNPSLFPKVSFQ